MTKLNTTQNHELSAAMQRILDFAKKELPTSVLCIMSFTGAEGDDQASINKIACNCETRRELVAQAAILLEHFLNTEVYDLSETIGPMQ